MTPSSASIGLQHILFTWSPAKVRPLLEARFETWPDAERALQQAASFIAPHQYLRVYFEVTWQGGACHRGRLDLTRLMALKTATPLSDHVRRSLCFFSGRCRPPYWTELQYQQALAEHLEHNPGDDVRCTHMLDNCDLGGGCVA